MTAEQTELRHSFGSDQSITTPRVQIMGPQGALDLMFFGIDRDGYRDRVNEQQLRSQIKALPLLRAVGVEMPKDQRLPIVLSDEVADALTRVGSLLVDISRLKDRIVLPNQGEEMQNFVQNALTAAVSKEPLPIITPCCPNWSQDKDGRYDYQYLEGGPSFIAEKVFAEAPPVLAAFKRYGIPYTGTVVIADWGLENDIAAFDGSGNYMTPEQVQACFRRTADHAKERLAAFQQEGETVFDSYDVMLMTELFKKRGIDAIGTYQAGHESFSIHPKGQKLVDELHRASMPINAARRGLTEEENRRQVVQSLAEYATFSSALPDHALLAAAESQTTSKGYNLFRQRKVPVFFLKGESRQSQAVNIL